MAPSLWTPSDSEADPIRISRLHQQIQLSIKKLQNSQFYYNFLSQLCDSQVLDRLAVAGALDNRSKLDMVIYGIGKIESREPPRLQLSFAILLKKELGYINNIEVFDPVLSSTECAVLEAMGCTVLSVDEEARREAWKPTLFYMPHCCSLLYENLLKTNWRPSMLNRMVVLGNSFECIELRGPTALKKDLGHVIGARRHVTEVGITATEAEWVSLSLSEEDDISFLQAFKYIKWHFFHLDPDADMNACLVALQNTPTH